MKTIRVTVFLRGDRHCVVPVTDAAIDYYLKTAFADGYKHYINPPSKGAYEFYPPWMIERIVVEPLDD